MKKLVLLLLFLPGCAGLSTQQTLTELDTAVSERTGQSFQTEPNVEIAAVVKELLKEELSTDTAVRIALINNGTLQATFAGLGIGQADLVQAGLIRNPVLDGDIRFGIGAKGTGADLGLVQNFVDVFQLPLRKRIAGAVFQQVKLQIENEAVSVAFDTKKAFYKLQGAEQLLEFRRQVGDALGASSELAKRQHKVGNITDLQLANEQVSYEQAKLELAAAEADAMQDREALNSLMGLWGEDTSWKIASRLPELPTEEIDPKGLETLAVSQRFDLKAQEQEILALGNTLGGTRTWGLFPDLSFGAAGQREISGEWSLGPSIGLPLPLFSQGQPVIFAASMRLKQSELRYKALATMMRAEVRSARNQMIASRSMATYYKNVLLPLRQRVVDQTLLEYNSMLVGAFQLLEAKRTQIEAGQKYVEALTDYWLSRTELEHAVGGRLSSAATEDKAPESDTPSMPGMNHHHEG